MQSKAMGFSGLLLAFLMVLAVNPTFASSIGDDPIGKWKFIVTNIPDTPDAEGSMMISKVGEAYKVSFTSDAGDADLTNVVLKDNVLTGDLDIQGIVLKLKGKFGSEGFEGNFNTEFGPLPITATKAAAEK